MYWFSGAPKLEGPDNAKEVTRFIDRFITTSGDDPEIHEVIQYQRHKHNNSAVLQIIASVFFNIRPPKLGN